MKHLVPLTLIVLLLAIAIGRAWARRSLALLSIEQKARVMDAASTGNVWPPVCLAIAVAVLSWLPPTYIPVSYRAGFWAAFLLTLFLLSLAATVTSLMRLSRLELPRPYVRSATFRVILFLVALLLFMGAVIYNASTYLRQRDQPRQSSNQAMQRTRESFRSR